MTLSEALEKVSAAYVPGIASYYEKLTPDPWQRAHNNLERILGIQDEAIVQAGLVAFVEECTRLIKAYESVNAPAMRLTAADAFYIGDEERVRKWQSRRHKHCYRCEAKENLTLVTDPKDPLSTLIVCADCKKRGAA